MARSRPNCGHAGHPVTGALAGHMPILYRLNSAHAFSPTASAVATSQTVDAGTRDEAKHASPARSATDLVQYRQGKLPSVFLAASARWYSDGNIGCSIHLRQQDVLAFSYRDMFQFCYLSTNWHLITLSSSPKFFFKHTDYSTLLGHYLAANCHYVFNIRCVIYLLPNC